MKTKLFGFFIDCKCFEIQ